jgi:hypothetical protein
MPSVAKSTCHCLVPLCPATPGPNGLCVVHERVRRGGRTHERCPHCGERLEPRDWVTSDGPIAHVVCPVAPRRHDIRERPLLAVAETEPDV